MGAVSMVAVRMNWFKRKKHTLKDEIAWLNDEILIRDDLIREQNEHILHLIGRVKDLEEAKREALKEVGNIIHERNRKG